MDRRRACLVLVAVTAGGPVLASRRVPLVGYLAGAHREGYFEPNEPGERFVSAMRRLGWDADRNVQYVWRFSDGHLRDAPRHADELVSLRPDVIVTWGAARTRHLLERTRSIPIVTMSADPVALGFARSLAAPGGNVTGLTNSAPAYIAKSVEFLGSISPPMRSVIAIHARQLATASVVREELARHGSGSGFAVVELEVGDAQDLDRRLAALPQGFKRGIVFTKPPIGNSDLAQLALHRKVALMASSRELVRAGLLASYSLSHVDEIGRVAAIVDKILRGASPATIPFEAPDRAHFAINLGTARALGIEVPHAWLTLADEVVR